MNFLSRTAVGIPISFVILMLLVGGVEEAAAFMFLSIICTAGISLVVWIPVWFVLGWIVFAIGEAAGVSPENKHPTRSPMKYVPTGIPMNHVRELRAVSDYMRRAEASGRSQDQIARQLLDAGWNIVIIDEARRQLTH